MGHSNSGSLRRKNNKWYGKEKIKIKIKKIHLSLINPILSTYRIIGMTVIGNKVKNNKDNSNHSKKKMILI
jgi:hypothetical protein